MLNDSFSNINLDDELDIADAKLIKPTATTVNSVLVLEVMRRERQDQANRGEKVLRLFDEETSKEAICILRDDWETMDVFPGDSVFITGDSTLICLESFQVRESVQWKVVFSIKENIQTLASVAIICSRHVWDIDLHRTYCHEAATYSCAMASLGVIDSRYLYVFRSVFDNFQQFSAAFQMALEWLEFAFTDDERRSRETPLLPRLTDSF